MDLNLPQRSHCKSICLPQQTLSFGCRTSILIIFVFPGPSLNGGGAEGGGGKLERSRRSNKIEEKEKEDQYP